MALLRRLFGIDLRALAAFRIALAAIFLGDLLFRWTDLEAHYTDFGVLPRTVLIDGLLDPGNLVPHLMSGSVGGEALLFAVAAVCGVAMLVGFYARIATFLSWLLLISIQNRNPLLLQGGDILLRCLFFWTLFLPVDAAYALRPSRHAPGSRSTPYLSVASAALLLQMAIMYFATALMKSGREWIPDGTAVYYALHIEQYVTPLGQWFRQFEGLLHWLTYAVWYFELVGPWLLFIPFFFPWPRLAAVAGFAGLHLGLMTCLELAHFPLVNFAALIPFLPSTVWDFLEAWASRKWSFVIPRSVSSPARGSRLGTAARELTAGFFLGYVVLWNLSNFPRLKIAVPSRLHWIAEATRIDQIWDMFAPYPLRDDGWFVIPGELKGGSTVNLFTGTPGPVSWEVPRHISATYPNDRWRSYLMNLWQAEYADYRRYYAEYLCRAWNREHRGPDSLVHLKIDYMEKIVPPPGNDAAPPQKIELWEQWCDETPVDID